MAKYENLSRAKKLKGWLEKLAYISVILDILITLVSLASLKSSTLTSTFLLYIDYVLAAEMILVIILFITMLFLSHYENIIERLSLMRRRRSVAKVRKRRATPP